MKLAIVGSHELRDGLYNDAKASVLTVLKLMRPDEVVSGGADGIDWLAEHGADWLGIPKRIFRPEVQRWEDSQGPRGTFKGFKTRNLEIAAYCTHLVAIRDATSTTNGSGWTYQQAKKLGKWARLIEL